MKVSSTRIWQRIFRTRATDTLPYTVSHQRIYIVPTGRGWAFLFALLLMLVASVNYALSLGYALSFLLTGLFSSTLLHTYRNLAGLQITHATADSTFAGEHLVFNITLANARTKARHGIRLGTSEQIYTTTRLPEEASTTIELALPTQQRGTHKLGRLTLQSDWPLGLWTTWSYLHTPVQGLVFPAPENNPPPLPSQTDNNDGTKPEASRHGDVSGLRTYVPGDSIGSIAWKSAARGLGLQVRTFDNDTGPTQAILSLRLTGKAQVEEQLSRLCAWILDAETTQTDYALQLPDEQLEIARGKAHRQRALTALALHGKRS